MLCEKDVSKKVKNKNTEEIAYVMSYADRPSVRLSNGIGFCVDSPIAKDWERVEEKKTLSDKIVITDISGGFTGERIFYEHDVKEAIKKYLESPQGDKERKEIFGERLL